MYIKYIATKDIVPVAFVVSGDDIAFSGNAITSTTTNLSGVLNGEWIQIINSAGNDGWFQLIANSTANSISVAQALITEVAGALVTLDGYEHGYGEEYTLEIGAESVTNKFDDDVKEVDPIDTTALSDFIDWGTDESWTIKTTYFDYSLKKYWKEFRSSVRGGATLEFDPYGTAASPVEPMIAQIPKKKNIQFSHIDDSLDLLISFTAKKVRDA